MELTTLLSQVFGIYLIVGGIAIWTRQRFFVPILGAFAKDPLQRLIVGTLELVAGLFIVLTHNVWTSAAASLVSLFGWMLVLEGAFYMIASDRTVAKMYKALDFKAWFTFGGIFALIVGVYLTAIGFGLL
ncbi:MAG TPA: hypothetical protein VEA92_03245 [Candidatus Paceibacterota bacterium]|nr:hypothetical protein [Candidatus Paceibacterota bacterium]